MDVVAEGIETAHQQEHLRKLGCRFGQGYLFSKPAPAEVAEALLLKQTDVEREFFAPLLPAGEKVMSHWAM